MKLEDSLGSHWLHFLGWVQCCQIIIKTNLAKRCVGVAVCHASSSLISKARQNKGVVIQLCPILIS